MEPFSIKQFILSEFNHEMTTTHKILERVPFDKFDWVPHPKSTPLGRLALHVASLPGMGVDIVAKDALSYDGKYNPPEVKNTDDILKIFGDTSGATRDALEASTDEDLAKTWSFSIMGKKMYEGDRLTAFQGFMLNHLIHHRAQLGVYLRLNNVGIPGSYGPSADEPF